MAYHDSVHPNGHLHAEHYNTHLLRLGCGRWSNFACDLAIIIIHAVNTVRMVDTSNPAADRIAVRSSIV